MRYFRPLALGALHVHIMLACSCANTSQITEQITTETIVIGDWDDLDAAMQAAMSASETAVIGRDENGAVVTFDVVSIHDERGKLIATRLGDGTEGVEIRVHAEHPVSRAKTPQRLVRAFALRLSELSGVETAP